MIIVPPTGFALPGDVLFAQLDILAGHLLFSTAGWFRREEFRSLGRAASCAQAAQCEAPLL